MTVDFNGKIYTGIFKRFLTFDIKGNVDDDLLFEYGAGAGAYNGCGATLMGEMWYFGGYSHRQVWISNRDESGRSNWVMVEGPNSKEGGPWLKRTIQISVHIQINRPLLGKRPSTFHKSDRSLPFFEFLPLE